MLLERLFPILGIEVPRAGRAAIFCRSLVTAGWKNQLLDGDEVGVTY